MTRDGMRHDRMAGDDEVVALLPFYLSDRLDENERAAVEHWLATSPMAERALDNARVERAAVTTANEAIEAPRNARARLDAALDAMPRRAHSVPWLARARQRVFDMFDFGDRRLAWGVAALLLAVVVGQATYLMLRRAPAGYELAGDDSMVGPTALADATVIFVPGAPISAVAALLQANGARIVSGPEGGLVWRISIAVEHAGGSKPERTARIGNARELVAAFTPTVRPR